MENGKRLKPGVLSFPRFPFTKRGFGLYSRVVEAPPQQSRISLGNERNSYITLCILYVHNIPICCKLEGMGSCLAS